MTVRAKYVRAEVHKEIDRALAGGQLRTFALQSKAKLTHSEALALLDYLRGLERAIAEYHANHVSCEY